MPIPTPVPRLIQGLRAPVKGLTGPWVHKYPHFAVPEPAIGFLQECLHWWDQWLKGIETGAMAEPAYRAYMQESAPPRAYYETREGRWIAEPVWPSPNITPKTYVLNPGALAETAAPEQALTLASPQTTGAAGGEFCVIWLGPEMPVDQRPDDAGSLVFDSPPLTERLEIFGAPVATLDLGVDQPVALIAVRLCDVAPDGASTRVTYGVLNLTHRDGHEHPTPLVPGERYRVRVQLDDIAHAFPPGHRIRLAVSTAYWPLVWPSPRPVMLTLYSGASTLDLPVRPPRSEDLRPFEPPESAPPLALEFLRAAANRRTIETDLANGETILRIVDDFGEARDPDHGLVAGSVARETYRIHPDDPLSARAEAHWTQTLARDAWRVRTEVRSVMTADATHFHVHANLAAFEGDTRIFDRTWDRKIPRDLV